MSAKVRGLVVVVGKNNVEELAVAELDMSAIVVMGSHHAGCGAQPATASTSQHHAASIGLKKADTQHTSGLLQVGGSKSPSTRTTSAFVYELVAPVKAVDANFVGLAQAVRIQHRLAELGLECLRGLALAVDRGVDQAGGNGVDADTDS